MLDTFVVPEITVEANGESEPIALGESAGKTFLLTLAITRIVEQEALDVSIWGRPTARIGARSRSSLSRRSSIRAFTSF